MFPGDVHWSEVTLQWLMSVCSNCYSCYLLLLELLHYKPLFFSLCVRFNAAGSREAGGTFQH